MEDKDSVEELLDTLETIHAYEPLQVSYIRMLKEINKNAKESTRRINEEYMKAIKERYSK